MARGDGSSGRQSDMSHDAVVKRLLQHVLLGTHGSSLVSVRVMDLRAIIDKASSTSRAAEYARQLRALTRRMEQARKLLEIDLDDIEFEEPQD